LSGSFTTAVLVVRWGQWRPVVLVFE